MKSKTIKTAASELLFNRLDAFFKPFEHQIHWSLSTASNITTSRPSNGQLSIAFVEILHSKDLELVAEETQNWNDAIPLFALVSPELKLDISELFRRGFKDVIRIDDQLEWQIERLTHRILSEANPTKDSKTAELPTDEIEFKGIMEAINQIIWCTDGTGGITYINQYGLNHFGKNLKEMKDGAWLEIIHPEDRDLVQQRWSAAVEGRVTYLNEQRMMTQEGVYHWFKVTANPQFDSQQNIFQWLGISIDIQHEKDTKEELIKTNEQLKVLADAGFALSELTSTKETLGYVAKELYKLVPDDALVITLMHDLQRGEYVIHETQGGHAIIQLVKKHFNISLNGMRGRLDENLYKDLKINHLNKISLNEELISGSPIPKVAIKLFHQLFEGYQVVTAPFHNESEVIGTAAILMKGDLPEHVGQEMVSLVSLASSALRQNLITEALKESEDRLTEAQRIGKIGSWSYDAIMDEYRFSEESLRIFELDGSRTYRFKDFAVRLHPADRGMMYNELAKVNKGKSTNITFRIVTPSGSKWINLISHATLDTKGKLIESEGTIQDISIQKQGESSLIDSAEKMVFLAESGTMLIKQKTTDELYEVIAQQIHRIFKDSAAVIVSQINEEEQSFNSHSLVGVNHYLEKFQNKIDVDFTNLQGSVEPESIALFKTGKVVRFNKSIRTLSDFIISEEVQTLITEALPSFEVVSIGLAQAGAVFGNVHILNFGSKENFDENLLEAFCNQASTVLARFQASDELRMSEERFRGVVDSFKEIIFTLDTNLVFTGLYGAWFNEQDVDRGTFMGKNVQDVFNQVNASLYKEAADKALGGQAASFEWTTQTNGKVQHYDTLLTPLHSSTGDINGLLGVARDITARWNHEQEILKNEQRMRVIANFAEDMIAMEERSQVFDYVTDRAYEMTGQKGYVVLTELSDDQTMFEIQTVRGVKSGIRKVLEFAGRPIEGLTGPVNQEMTDMMSGEFLVDLPVNLTQLTDSAFAKRLSTNLLSTLGIDTVKCILIRDEKRIMATLNFILPNTADEIPVELLRALLNQSTLALARIESSEIIRSNQKALNQAQKLGKLGSWHFDLRTNEFNLSDHALRIYGFDSHDQVSRGSMLSRLSKEDQSLTDLIGQTIQSGKTFEFEHQIISDKGIKWVLATLSPNIGDNGEILGIDGTVLDISSRKEAELKLEESENRFRNLIERNSDVILVENEDSDITYVSPSVHALLGYDEIEMLSLKKVDIIHPLDIPSRDELFARLKEEGSRVEKLKMRIKRKSGDYIWVLATFSDQRSVKGIEGIVVNIKDIELEERVQRALKESNERFEYATEATKDVIWEWDLTNNSIFWGNSFERVFGHEIKSIDSLKDHPFIHEEDREKVINSVRTSVFDLDDHYWNAEYRFMRSDGSYAWVSDNATILRDENNKPYRVIGAISDITDRVQYERSIEEQNERLKDIAWMQSHIVRSPLTNLMGLVSLLRGMDNEERSDIEERIYKSAEELDGVIRTIVKNAERLKGDGAPVSTWRYNALSTDIKELYLHPDLMDNSTQSYVITNKYSKVVYCNPAFTELSEYAFNDIHEQHLAEVLSGPETQKDILDFISSQEEVRKPYEAELVIYKNSGDPAWIRVTSQPFISKEGTFSGYFHTINDISDEKGAEEIILEKTRHLAQMNEDLKQFTYTVSHDLKAPANSLQGLLELLEMESKSELNERSSEYITRALQSVERLRNMIEALLVYSRSGVVSEDLKVISVKELVQDARVALSAQIKKHSATIDVEGNELEVKVYPLLFSRVIQNLMHNSMKFKQDGLNPHISIRVTEESKFWVFEFADNGIGIDALDLSQVFDLFYYKSEDRSPDSHGIGLAIVKRAVEQHHGEISVESELGIGTKFRFTVSKTLSNLI